MIEAIKQSACKLEFLLPYWWCERMRCWSLYYPCI